MNTQQSFSTTTNFFIFLILAGLILGWFIVRATPVY